MGWATLEVSVCPECGSSDQLWGETSYYGRLFRDGHIQVEGPCDRQDYDDPAWCDCGWNGTWSDTRVDVTP